MCTMGTEDEFELEKDGIDVPSRQKIIRIEKIVIILQPDL